jgi:hypothetical protein
MDLLPRKGFRSRLVLVVSLLSLVTIIPIVHTEIVVIILYLTKLLSYKMPPINLVISNKERIHGSLKPPEVDLFNNEI